MSPVVADAAAAVRADMAPFHKDLNAGLAKGGKQIDTLGARLKSALTPGNLLAAGGIGIGLAQVTSFLGDAVAAAGDLGETVSKTGQIFGQEALPGLERWAETAAEAFGQSKQQALDAASTFATFGKAAGLAGNDLVGFSTELTELASDLASFHNADPSEVVQALGAALRGESEPMRRFGVLMDDASLRAAAFRDGLISSTKEALTPQTKALAAHALIMEQTVDAQGDYERTSDSLANQQRELQSKFADVTAEIGTRLLPVMVDFVTFVNDEGIPALKTLMDILDQKPGATQDIPIIGEIDEFLHNVGVVGREVGDHLHGWHDQISAAAELVGTDYLTMSNRVRRIMRDFNVDQDEAIRRVTILWTDAGGELAQTIPPALKHATADVGDAATEMAQQIPDAMEEAKAEAEEVARQTPGSLANQLREGIDDYDKAIDELAETAANSVSDLSERQKIEGILASEELTDALNSDSTRTRLLALELVSDLVSDYELLAPGALEAGSLVNPSLQDGIESNLGLATDAGEAVVDAAGNPLVELAPQAYGWGSEYSRQFMLGMASYWQRIRNTAVSLGEAAAVPLRFRSPPVMGPLSDSDKWGGKYGALIAEGMYGSLGTVAGASNALAEAAATNLVRPSFGPAPLAASATAGAVGSGPSYHLHTNGVSKSFERPEDFLQALYDMAAFRDGDFNG